MYSKITALGHKSEINWELKSKSTFPSHHIQNAGLHQDCVAFWGGQSHGLGRLKQMQHVGLRTEVQLRVLFLHIYVNTVDAAPYTLREGEEEGGETEKEKKEKRKRKLEGRQG